MLVQHITDYSHATGKSASACLALIHQITLSVCTVQRYIKQIHIHRHKGRLYNENRSSDYNARVQCAHAYMPTDWNNVIFIDEITFTLSFPTHMHVTLFDEPCTVPNADISVHCIEAI